MFLPHFDVLCDLLLDRCTATWNLFVLYNKELNFVRMKAALFHVRRSKVWRLPHFSKREKSHLASSMIYTKRSNPIGCCALAKNCDWFREITPLSNLTRASLLVEWTYSEARIELRNTLGKLAIAVNLEAIRFEFWTERSVSDGGNLCSLWSVILKSVWNSIGDTF